MREYQEIGYTVLKHHLKQMMGLKSYCRYLAGKTVFAGQSGVGKSSLLNTINPELSLKTNDISCHLGRGKHTTRHVELIQIGSWSCC